ncbi:MAG: hypothetical protein PHT12_02165 [Patescibacteria group bacterium]|nr:hypothetical protein [Patescibacteria group bacterium]
MTQRPTILHVGEFDLSWNDGTEWQQAEAVSHFLGTTLAAEIISYPIHEFRCNRRRLRRLWASGALILAVTQRDRHALWRENVEEIRACVSPDVPIAVLEKYPNCRRLTTEDTDVRNFSYPYGDFLNLAKRLIEDWRQTDWLGAAGSELAEARLLAALHRAYDENADEEESLGVPDHNGRAVAEALRIKLLPVSRLTDEFDRTLDYTPREFLPAEAEIYEAAAARIRAMPDSERVDFAEELFQRTWGDELGPGVCGFAIEVATKQTTVTSGYGNHRRAADQLACRFEKIVELQVENAESRGYSWAERPCQFQYRIFGGLIVSSCWGIPVPIVRFDIEHIDEEQREAASFLMRERKYLPVGHDGRLIEG